MTRFISIPMAPIGKARPRFGGVRGGKPVVYTPAKTAKAEAAIRTAWGLRHGTYTKRAPCVVVIDAQFKGTPERINTPHVQKPDLDNIVKLCLDALNGSAFVDDCLVWNVTAQKKWGDHDQLFVAVEYQE